MDPLSEPNKVDLPDLQEPNKSRRTTTVVLLVVAVLIFALAYFFLNSPQSSYLSKVTGSGDMGVIHLTLKSNEPGSKANLFVFDVEKKQLQQLLGDGHLNMTGSLSPDKHFMAYSSVDLDDSSTQITILNLEDGTRKQITKSGLLSKRNPEWSPTGDRIAFAARSPGRANEPFLKPDSWSVHITDLDGNNEHIVRGIYPQWSPDGKKLVLLKGDGIYLYDLEKKETQNVWWVAEGKAGINMKIDVSRDGKRLAWSNIQGGEILIGEISSWEPFNVESSKKIETDAFWVVFSPDGKYLAAQEFDLEEGKDPFNPRLVIYNIDTLEEELEFSLSEYVQTNMFVTDWR